MAIGPRVDPFPYQAFSIDKASYDINGESYYNDPTLDGVSYNVRLAGNPASWLNTWVYPGVFAANSSYNEVAGGVFSPSYDYVGTVYPNYMDTWRYSYNIPITNPTVLARYTGTWVGGAQDHYVGTTTYPGVASTNGFEFYIEPHIYSEQPAWFEVYFSENDQRTDPSTGFSGYTIPGDFGNAFVSMYITSPGYTRRYLSGFIRMGADPATCSTADIIYGVLVIGTNTAATAYLCINGVVAKSLVTSAVEEVTGWGDPIWSESTDKLAGKATGYDDLGVNLYLRNSTTQFLDIYFNWNTPSDPLSWSVGLDTYDVKFVGYVDFVADAGPGVLSGSASSDRLPMYTHPGWPVGPSDFVNTPSVISNGIPDTTAITSVTNPYTVSADGIITDNVHITPYGEIRAQGLIGTNGDAITSYGTGQPVGWSSTIAQLEVRLAAADATIQTLESNVLAP
jgi:hypothetical protein